MTPMAESTQANPIDALMDRASGALAETDYFEAATLASAGLRQARAAGDFERMARIVLPLQEARRQIREAAVDDGGRFLVRRTGDVPDDRQPGCYLVEPPLVGMDARQLREVLFERRVPALVLAREPLTSAGLWPIVGVGDRVVRTRVKPPPGVRPLADRVRRDDNDQPPPASWFVAAEEALGDEAIAAVDPGEPAAFRIDDLLERLEAVPEHEKLHQALEAACRQALREPAPVGRRHRPLVDDPFSF